MERKVLDWIDYVCDDIPQLDKQVVIKAFESGQITLKEFEDIGIVCYLTIIGFTGKKEFIEVMFYIKQEKRNLINLNRMLAFLESIAKKENCDIIKIGGNSEYNDEAFLKYLKRKGYSIDVVKKEVK